MSTSSEHHEDQANEQTEELLRELFAELTPIRETAPASLADGALWLHRWHMLELELAEILEEPATAGVRAGPASTSLVTYRLADGSTVRVEIERSRLVSLTIAIPEHRDATVELLLGSAVRTASADVHGVVRFEALPSGTCLGFFRVGAGTLRFGPLDL